MTTFAVVTIDGQDYPSFESVADADTYLAADPNATAWRALGTDPAGINAKGQYLVSSTRILLRQDWKPGALDDPLDQRVKDATAELASAMASGYDAANEETTASGIKRQKAGSVEQEFFAPGLVGPAGNRFPLPVWELIRDLLVGGNDTGLGGSMSSGTCGRSISEIPYDFTGGYGSDLYSRDYE